MYSEREREMNMHIDLAGRSSLQRLNLEQSRLRVRDYIIYIYR